MPISQSKIDELKKRGEDMDLPFRYNSYGSIQSRNSGKKYAKLAKRGQKKDQTKEEWNREIYECLPEVCHIPREYGDTATGIHQKKSFLFRISCQLRFGIGNRLGTMSKSSESNFRLRETGNHKGRFCLRQASISLSRSSTKSTGGSRCYPKIMLSFSKNG